MPEKPLLVPYPRKLTFTEGAFTGNPFASITDSIDGEIVPQGYRLTVAPDGITIAHSDVTGIAYGRQTLAQLVRHYGKTLPAMVIDDAPDFERRGVMLDCSRDRVPQLKTLYALIDKLAAWKINELQLYIEHTFAYEGHEVVWERASPFTPSDIWAIDHYCRERYIDLVPCQSSLGHMERWLMHPKYHHLAETPDGFAPPWDPLKKQRVPATLDPNDPGSFPLVASLFDQLIPNFSSEYVNVCDDEPFELGLGKNKQRVEAEGGRVYLDYLLKLYKHVTAKGKKVQFWADIITQHPDLVAELPTDIIPLVWGYEDWQPSEQQVEMVSQSALDFYVCPGTSSWNSLVGRTDNATGNLKHAATLGLEYRAMGYLNTDWGDYGHWQPLSVSYLGFLYGAGVSWCLETNADMDIPAALDRFAFEDDAGVMGRAVYDLGNVYRMIPLPQFNSQWFFNAARWSDGELHARYDLLLEEHGAEPLQPETVRAAMAQIEMLVASMDDARMRVEDELIKSEFRQAAHLLLHGAKRTLRLLGEAPASDADLKAELEGLIERQRDLWMERSRPGGLDDSVAKFRDALASYG